MVGLYEESNNADEAGSGLNQLAPGDNAKSESFDSRKNAIQEMWAAMDTE